MRVTLSDLVVETTPDPTADGIRWKLTDLKNWWAQRIRADVTDMPDSDGGFDAERSLRSVKSMALEGIITAPSSEAAVALGYMRLNGLAPKGEKLTLTVVDPAGTFTMDVRVTSIDVAPFHDRRAKFQVGMIAADPRKYGPWQSAAAAPAGGSADGLIWPLMGDVGTGVLDFGEFSPTGLMTLTNTGTAPTWVSFLVTGAIDSAGFQVVSDADVIEFSGPVPLGQQLVLDPYAGGRAILSGVDVTGESLTRSEWPALQGGETRIYSFDPLGVSDGNASIEARYREAWW